MLLIRYKGCELHQPTSGGSAGKGRNVTSTIQLRCGGMIIWSKRFKTSKAGAREQAIAAAKKYARTH